MSGWRAALVASIVGALILITGYVVPRLGGGDQSGPSGIEEDISGLVLVCVPALEPACDAVAAEIGIASIGWEPDGDLPDRHVLVAPAGDLPEGATTGTPIAESPIVIGAWLDRSQVLSAHCGQVDFECIGSTLGSTWEEIGGNDAWGDFKLGLADPSRSETGMLGWSTAQPLATRSDMSHSLRLVTVTDARLTSDLVLFGDSRADVVITTEVALFGQLDNAIGRGGRLEIFYPASSPWVTYVAVGDGFGSGGLLDRLTEPEIAQLFATAGLRPVTGSVTYPQSLGTPGSRSAPPDQSTRATLLEAWERTR